MPNHKVSKEELGILLHTLGLSDPYQKHSYRNYFVAAEDHADYPLISELCKAGFMVEGRAPGFLSEGDRVFLVTELGRAAALQLRPRPTRAQERYHRFLELCECWPDFTFREFLKRESEEKKWGT